MLLLGLGDIIDDSDPCTLNPSDPICQAFGPAAAKDPCKLDPTQPFCQPAIAAQFPDPNAALYSTMQQTLPTMQPTNIVMPSLPAASLAMMQIPWKTLFVLGVLGAIGAYGYHHYAKRRKH